MTRDDNSVAVFTTRSLPFKRSFVLKYSNLVAVNNYYMNKVINVIVSAGAAVIIFGAWAKILHMPFADLMLSIGLLTEAAIFLIYAFLPSLTSDKVENISTGKIPVKIAEITKDLEKAGDNYKAFGEESQQLVSNVRELNRVCENILNAIKN